MLQLDNSTRWNSLYDSWVRAQLLRQQIATFCFENRHEPGLETMTDEDWDEIDLLINLLRPFWKATMRLQSRAPQGHHGAIWEGLPTLERLLSHLEVQQLSSDPFIQSRANQGWTKIRKYYDKTDYQQHLYAAAVILHPARKTAYFEKIWKGDDNLLAYIPSFIKATREHWETHYRPLYEQEEMQHKEYDESDDEYEPTSIDVLHEFDDYLQLRAVALHPQFNPIAWWQQNRGTFPTLSLYAFDLLSIPAMSTECERSFSVAKHTLEGRWRLGDEVFEATDCLRNWHRNGLMTEAYRAANLMPTSYNTMESIQEP